MTRVATGGRSAPHLDGATARGSSFALIAAGAALLLGLAQSAPAQEQPHLRYFGFSGGCETETFVQETAPFSNVCLIEVEDPRLLDEEWVAKMMVRKMRLIVATHYTFFERVEIDEHEWAVFDLYADYRQRWRDAIAGKEDALRALAEFFYVADEPNWTGISRSELAAAVQEIKLTLPGARTITSFNRMLDNDWFEGQEVPTDAVGYHQYALRDPRLDSDYQAHVDLVKAHAPGKGFFYVLDSWWTAGRHGAEGLDPLDMAEVARNVYEMAARDPDAVGIVGFHWPTFIEGTGARDLPGEVKWTYWSIGSEITGKCLGPTGVDAKTALFFDGCSYFATFEYGASDGSTLAAAMPRERSYGTWVLAEGDVLGALKIEDGETLRVYPSFHTDAPAAIRIYDSADGRLVWDSEVEGAPGNGPVPLPRRSSARVKGSRVGG